VGVPQRADPTPGRVPTAQPKPQAEPHIDEEATLMMPPEANPVAAPLQPVKPTAGKLKQSFEEPTHIPAPAPPPIDSGAGWPALTSDVGLPFGSPLGDPADERRRKRMRALTVYGAIAAAALLTALIVGGYMVGSDSATRGTLEVVSLPTGAEVRLDGNAAPQLTPVALNDVDPRTQHHLRVSKSGYDVWEQDVRFPAGERKFGVQAVLVPTVGTVEISSTPPGAEAIVNGRIRGQTPTTVGDLPPNDDVVIELRLRGYKVAHKTVQWNGKRLVQLSIPLEKAK
jgi:hypothetical protein